VAIVVPSLPTIVASVAPLFEETFTDTEALELTLSLEEEFVLLGGVTVSVCVSAAV